MKAESSNNSGYIKVEWTISSEDGVDHYVIERKSGGNDNYYEVGVVSRGTFSFEDRKDLFRSADGKVFSYRISARDASDRILTEITSQSTVYYSTASVAKRTWGSIKAMFR